MALEGERYIESLDLLRAHASPPPFLSPKSGLIVCVDGCDPFTPTFISVFDTKKAFFSSESEPRPPALRAIPKYLPLQPRLLFFTNNPTLRAYARVAQSETEDILGLAIKEVINI